MKTNFYEKRTVIIHFDDVLESHHFFDTPATFDIISSYAETLMHEYGFEHAIICDAKTDTIIADLKIE